MTDKMLETKIAYFKLQKILKTLIKRLAQLKLIREKLQRVVIVKKKYYLKNVKIMSGEHSLILASTLASRARGACISFAALAFPLPGPRAIPSAASDHRGIDVCQL